MTLILKFLLDLDDWINPYLRGARPLTIFCLMQLKDFLFNRVLSNKLINGDRIFLTDPIGSVGSLVFNGRIPPRIQMDYVVGSGQI